MNDNFSKIYYSAFEGGMSGKYGKFLMPIITSQNSLVLLLVSRYLYWF